MIWRKIICCRTDNNKVLVLEDQLKEDRKRELKRRCMINAMISAILFVTHSLAFSIGTLIDHPDLNPTNDPNIISENMSLDTFEVTATPKPPIDVIHNVTNCEPKRTKKKLKKVISYSIYGGSDLLCYHYGALENALIAQSLFPDWKVYFYIDSSIKSLNVLEKLKNEKNAEIFYMNHTDLSQLSMMWRFEPAFYDDVDIAIVRDADSRLRISDRLVVTEWLESDKDFHIIRDNPNHHHIRILGGMWGARNHILAPFKEDYYKFFSKNESDVHFGMDQEFLKDVVYPKIIENDTFIHDPTHHFKEEVSVKTIPKHIPLVDQETGHIGDISCETKHFYFINRKYKELREDLVAYFAQNTHLQRETNDYGQIDYTRRLQVAEQSFD